MFIDQIERCLCQVLEETVQVEKSGGLLAKCIRDKEAPLMLAHTRLATRVPRPNMEACRDLAQHR
jgi:Tektin family